MGPSHYIKPSSIISTVCSCQHKVIRDERTSTEPGIVNKESHNPGPLVFLSLKPPNYPTTCLPGVMAIVLQTTDILKVPLLPLVSCPMPRPLFCLSLIEPLFNIPQPLLQPRGSTYCCCCGRVK